MIKKRNGKILVPRGRRPLARWILDEAAEAKVKLTIDRGPDGKDCLVFHPQGLSEEQRQTLTDLILVCIGYPGAHQSAVKLLREAQVVRKLAEADEQAFQSRALLGPRGFTGSEAA